MHACGERKNNREGGKKGILSELQGKEKKKKFGSGRGSEEVGERAARRLH